MVGLLVGILVTTLAGLGPAIRATRISPVIAMRNPSPTASTAAALMIGVALVVFVSVIASGLKQSTTGTLEHQIQASDVVAASDGYSPIDPAVAGAIAGTPGVTGTSGVAQDQVRALIQAPAEGPAGAWPCGPRLVQKPRRAGGASAYRRTHASECRAVRSLPGPGRELLLERIDAVQHGPDAAGGVLVQAVHDDFRVGELLAGTSV